MKRVGTLSSAIGLIFFGVWMIINQNNRALADEIIKLWPTIFIIIGIEILFYFNYKGEERKVGFNPLVVFVIILFMMSNAFLGIKDNFINGLDINMNSSDDWFGIFDNRYNKINIKKSMDFKGDKVTIKVNNGIVQIKKSEDKEIKIEGTVSVSKSINNYNISEIVDDNKITFDLEDNKVKKADLTLYLPEELLIDLESNNIKFESNDDDFKGDYIVNSNNGTISIKGNAEKAKVTLNNGTVSIKNKLSKDINVNMNNGTVNVDTEDKNLEIKADIDAGITTLNRSRIINSGIIKSYGSGEGKVSIKVDHGTVNIKSQE